MAKAFDSEIGCVGSNPLIIVSFIQTMFAIVFFRRECCFVSQKIRIAIILHSLSNNNRQTNLKTTLSANRKLA